mgnify:CR=1 FL=1
MSPDHGLAIDGDPSFHLIHVVVPHERLPLNDAMVFQGPGGGRAARIDPGFQAARTRGAQAAELQQAAQTSGRSRLAIASRQIVPNVLVEMLSDPDPAKCELATRMGAHLARVELEVIFRLLLERFEGTDDHTRLVALVAMGKLASPSPAVSPTSCRTRAPGAWVCC